MIFSDPIPLSLYIHLPWCVRKCPYCDFNSHTLRTELPEEDYILALLTDLAQEVSHQSVKQRVIQSIFIGGGTPSLFSPQAIEALLTGAKRIAKIAPNAEITLEANPGTVDQAKFIGFYQAGVNRLSLGIQSFNPTHLQHLGRIHGENEAIRAIDCALTAGFTNINLDLMHGLPNQTVAESLADLNRAITFRPTHISWYQLTLEPNTPFFHQPPPLPAEDDIANQQHAGYQLLRENGYHRYEISAFSQPGYHCQHNLNYWQFGDYLGIGAGACGKITDIATGSIIRTTKTKHPKSYLNNPLEFSLERHEVLPADRSFEWMLNALRLLQPLPLSLFSARTGLNLDTIAKQLQELAAEGLLLVHHNTEAGDVLVLTELGERFVNDVIARFLVSKG